MYRCYIFKGQTRSNELNTVHANLPPCVSYTRDILRSGALRDIDKSIGCCVGGRIVITVDKSSDMLQMVLIS